MPIRVTCECGKVTNVPDAYAGRTGKCPACGRAVKVPSLSGAIPPPMPAPKAPTPPPIPEIQQPQYEPEEAAVAVAWPEDSAAADVHEDPYETAQPVGPPPLEYMAPGAGGGEGGIIAPPPSDAINIPTFVPEKLRQPNSPPLFLIISAAGADISTKFNPSPILESLVEMLAKKMKNKFDLRLDPPTSDVAAPIVFVRIIRISPGNRFLRYFGLLGGLLGGATHFEVDGNVQAPGVAHTPFNFKHKSYIGLFGGSSLSLLKLNAKVVAKKIAGRVKKVAK